MSTIIKESNANAVKMALVSFVFLLSFSVEK